MDRKQPGNQRANDQDTSDKRHEDSLESIPRKIPTAFLEINHLGKKACDDIEKLHPEQMDSPGNLIIDRIPVILGIHLPQDPIR